MKEGINTPIDELLKEYVDEDHPTNIESILKIAEVYISRMDDCQVRVLLHQMVKHIKGE